MFAATKIAIAAMARSMLLDSSEHVVQQIISVMNTKTTPKPVLSDGSVNSTVLEPATPCILPPKVLAGLHHLNKAPMLVAVGRLKSLVAAAAQLPGTLLLCQLACQLCTCT